MSERTKLDKVRAYYASFDEWSRLESPEGARELARTLEILTEQLTPGARVLDLGGGPGRYAIELARRGHFVTLADLSPTLLETARQKVSEAGLESRVQAFDELGATNLEIYADASFDAVIAFGPFYHLVSDAERRQAAAEIRRVLAPSGQAYVTFIPRLSGLIGLIDRAAKKPGQVPAKSLAAAAETGVFSNAAESGFQEGYYPLPRDMEELFQSSGFRIESVLSLKSIANELGEHVASLAAEVRAEVERIARDLCRHPEVVAMSGHALLIVSPR